MGALKIPDDLLEQANRVPGLDQRLVRFIKLEVAQHEMRHQRFAPDTLELVARAHAKADEYRALGVDLAVEKDAFLKRLDRLTRSEDS